MANRKQPTVEAVGDDEKHSSWKKNSFESKIENNTVVSSVSTFCVGGTESYASYTSHGAVDLS